MKRDSIWRKGRTELTHGKMLPTAGIALATGEDSLLYPNGLAYAAIRRELEIRSLIIGPNDLKIAAVCLAHGLTLTSSNTDEFGRVAGLRVEDWAET